MATPGVSRQTSPDKGLAHPTRLKQRIEPKGFSGTKPKPTRPTIPLYCGEPDPSRKGVAISESAARRFARRVDKSGGPDACWPWTSPASTGFGYGRMKLRGRLVSPHRVAYAIANGEIGSDRSYHGHVVMHSCDNPICCNPAHLVLGDQHDNVLDMIAKGRRRRSPSAPTAGGRR